MSILKWFGKREMVAERAEKRARKLRPQHGATLLPRKEWGLGSTIMLIVCLLPLLVGMVAVVKEASDVPTRSEVQVNIAHSQQVRQESDDARAYREAIDAMRPRYMKREP